MGFWSGVIFGLLGGAGLAVAAEFGKDVYQHYLRPKQFQPTPEPEPEPPPADKLVDEKWAAKVLSNPSYKALDSHWVNEAQVEGAILNGWDYLEAPDDDARCYRVRGDKTKEYLMIK